MKNLLIIIGAIVLLSCNSQKSIKADLEANKNEIFKILLKSNPSTGYSWKWIKNSTLKNFDSIGSNYIPAKVKEGIVGSGGNEVWKFKANQSGIDTLQFEYQRSWDGNSTIETKKIIVKIN